MYSFVEKPMKKVMSLLLIAALCLSFAACRGKANTSSPEAAVKSLFQAVKTFDIEKMKGCVKMRTSCSFPRTILTVYRMNL